jgi:hypothetical protein
MSITLGNGTQYYWGDGDLLQAIFGQNGDDFLTEYGSLNLLEGGNGQDEIYSFGTANILYGNNGNDFLVAGGNSPAIGTSMFGGSGNDFVGAMGFLNNLHGDSGDDVLLVMGSRNAMDGGKGNDILASFSVGNTNAIGLGSNMEGGSGLDGFYLDNSSDLRVLSDGVSIVGVFDVIRDYAEGELIDVGGLQAVSPPLNISGGHPVLGDGEYTFVQGNLARNGHFDIADAGLDLLLIYDRANGDNGDQQGAVVLIGVTDPMTVTLGVVVG